MRFKPYRQVVDLLFAQLPEDDDVLLLMIERPVGSDGIRRMTVRATTIGLLAESDRARFAMWPGGAMLKHWRGAVAPNGQLELGIASIDHPPAT